MGIESFRREKETYDLADYSDRPYFHILNKLPHELALRHIEIIESRGISDIDAAAYLKEILTKRHEAISETFVSDYILKDAVAGKESEFFTSIETTVLDGPNIGNGQTADVKRFDFQMRTSKLPMAVKYVLRPNERTLSASAEHDMLEEVERIQIIEEIEQKAHVERVRVPHPYFHHKSNRIQCYGMEFVDGATMLDAISNRLKPELRIDLKNSLSKITEKELFAQIDTFFNEMHSYCLHGDIKPKNIMVDKNGTFFVIDFGQSSLVSRVPEEKMGFLDNLKMEEVRWMKVIVSRFLKKLFQDENA